MNVARYIYFTKDLPRMAAFYQDVLGLKIKPSRTQENPEEWLELASGDFVIALHRLAQPGLDGRNRNKLVFYAKDVAKQYEVLKAKRVKVGKLSTSAKLNMFDFKDPDGNTLQISDR